MRASSARAGEFEDGAGEERDECDAYQGSHCRCCSSTAVRRCSSSWILSASSASVGWLAGVSVRTKVPWPMRLTTIPCSCRSFTALWAVCLATAYFSARSGTEGIWLPGG